VWVFLKKERRNDSYNKFKKKKIGPRQVLKKINDNAYEIELPPNIKTHLTSNSQDLSAYHGELDGSSWTSSFSLVEDDVVPNVAAMSCGCLVGKN
jgi:hypothetical protein